MSLVTWQTVDILYGEVLRCILFIFCDLNSKQNPERYLKWIMINLSLISLNLLKIMKARAVSSLNHCPLHGRVSLTLAVKLREFHLLFIVYLMLQKEISEAGLRFD
jgi:hypothetical protein